MALRKIQPRSHKELSNSVEDCGDRKMFPRLRIELVHLPEAKKWEIGKEYDLKLRLKQTGLSISKFQNDAEFDIIGIDPKQG